MISTSETRQEPWEVAMNNQIEIALQAARRGRTEGRTKDAELAYGKAAELSRTHEDPAALAHALRHLSDLARQRGGLSEAWGHASEAADLYRKGGDRLGLANAIRLMALSADGRELARSCWLEARELYSTLDVKAGVTECDSYLLD